MIAEDQAAVLAAHDVPSLCFKKRNEFLSRKKKFPEGLGSSCYLRARVLKDAVDLGGIWPTR